MARASAKKDIHPVDERTKPAFLRRVRVRGYKSIAFCDVSLQPLTILVGRNASGKSNFVDALAFLADALTTNVAEAARLHGTAQSLLCRTCKTSRIEIEIEAEFSSAGGQCLATYSIELLVKHRAIEAGKEILRIRDRATERVCGFDVVHGRTKWTGLEDFADRGFARVSPERARTKSGHQSSPFPHLFDELRPDRLLLAVIGSQPFIDLAEPANSRNDCHRPRPEAPPFEPDSGLSYE